MLTFDGHIHMTGCAKVLFPVFFYILVVVVSLPLKHMVIISKSELKFGKEASRAELNVAA